MRRRSPVAPIVLAVALTCVAIALPWLDSKASPRATRRDARVDANTGEVADSGEIVGSQPAEVGDMPDRLAGSILADIPGGPQPALATLRGEVVWDDGSPARGIMLCVASTCIAEGARREVAGTVLSHAYSDDDGVFTVQYVGHGASALTAAIGDNIAYISHAPREWRRIVLPREAPALSGQVVDEKGEPIADVDVQVIVRSSVGVAAYGRQTTDSRGQWLVEGLPVGPASIWAEVKGYAVSDMSTHVPGAVWVVLIRGYTIEGAVVDFDSGRPIGEKARIHYGNGPVAKWLTEADGSFRIAGFPKRPDGQCDVRVLATGYAPNCQPLNADTATGHVVLWVRRAATVTCRCVGEEGEPLSGVVGVVQAQTLEGVRPAWPVSAISDKEGRLVVQDVYPAEDTEVTLYWGGMAVWKRVLGTIGPATRVELGDVVIEGASRTDPR